MRVKIWLKAIELDVNPIPRVRVDSLYHVTQTDMEVQKLGII